MTERVVRAVVWLACSRGLVQIVSLASTVLVARLLSPSDYGVVAVAAALIGTLLLAAELGIASTIVQFPQPKAEELNACFWLALVSAGAVYLLLHWGASTIAGWFDMPLLDPVLRVMGLTLPVASVRHVPEGLLRKRLDLDKLAKGEAAVTILSVPLVVGAAYAGAGVWALVGGVVFLALGQTVAAYWFAGWRPGVRFGSARPRALIRFSAATVGARFFASTYQQVDAFVLGKIAGEAVLGLFTIAKQVALLPVEKISAVVGQVVFPVLAELQADRGATRRAFLTGVRLVTSLTIPLGAGMALVADDLVAVVLTDKWMPAVPLLQVLCLYGLIRSLDVLLPPVLFARYRATFLCWYTLGLLIVMPVVFWAGAASIGAMGVALSWVVVYPAVMTRMAREVLRELEIGWNAVWGEVRTAVWATLLMTGVVLAIRWLMPGADVPARAVRLATVSSVGALVYGLAILRYGHALAADLTQARGVFRPPPVPPLQPRAAEGPLVP